MPIVKVDHITKEFRLGQLTSMGEGLRKLASRFSGKAAPSGRAPFKALDDVSFSVESGEVLGIIGHNGAGKSTLLKMLAGIIRPTHGTVSVLGKVAPLIEVGAGLVPDMTGRENVFLNAAILGMKREQIRRKFDEIVQFAEIEEFIDTPIKRYSSGMQVRLGFAIATAVESQILIVDEVLAVGDLAFQRKCFERIERLIKREGRTVFLVSHNIRQVERLCTRAMLLERGRIVQIGSPTQVCNLFYERSDEAIQGTRSAEGLSTRRVESSQDVELISLQVRDSNGNLTNTLRCLERATFEIVYETVNDIPNPVFGFGFHTTDFVYLATVQSLSQIECRVLSPGRYMVTFCLLRVPFLPGVYCIRVGVALGDAFQALFYVENAAQVRIVDSGMNRAVTSSEGEGFVQLEGQWQLSEIDASVSPEPLTVE